MSGCPCPRPTSPTAIRLLLDRDPQRATRSPFSPRSVATCQRSGATSSPPTSSSGFIPTSPAREAPAPVLVTLDSGVRIVVDLSDHAVGLPIARHAFERNELEFVGRTVRAGPARGGRRRPRRTLRPDHGTAGGAGRERDRVRADGEAGRLARAGHPRRTASSAVSRSCGPLSPDRSGEGVMIASRADLQPRRGVAAAGRPRALPRLRHTVVRLVALDDAALPRPVSFIRLDVEGAEARVLRGRRAPARRGPAVAARRGPRGSAAGRVGHHRAGVPRPHARPRLRRPRARRGHRRRGARGARRLTGRSPGRVPPMTPVAIPAHNPGPMTGDGQHHVVDTRTRAGARRRRHR